MRRASRIVLRVLVVVLAVLVLLAAALLGLARHRPRNYRPAHLSADQQDQVVGLFIDHFFKDFGNNAGAGVPFDWTITAEQANAYLGSLDAIAALQSRPVRVRDQLKRVGLADMAVAFEKGKLTLMVLLERYGVVLGADLKFIFDQHGDVRAEIVAVRVGSLPVPKFLVERQLARLRREMADQLAQAEQAQAAGVPLGELAKVLRAVVDSLEGKPVLPELVWRLGGSHRVLVESVEIGGGKATLHMVPVSRPAAPAASTLPAQPRPTTRLRPRAVPDAGAAESAPADLP